MLPSWTLASLAAQSLWKENPFLFLEGAALLRRAPAPEPRPRPAQSIRRAGAPGAGSQSSSAVRPLPTVHSRFYNFCRLLGGAKMSPARPRKVETIFGIQKGSCRTRTQSAPKTHACPYRSGEFVIRGASGKLQAGGPLRRIGLGCGRGSGSASGEGASREGRGRHGVCAAQRPSARHFVPT